MSDNEGKGSVVVHLPAAKSTSFGLKATADSKPMLFSLMLMDHCPARDGRTRKMRQHKAVDRRPSYYRRLCAGTAPDFGG